MEEEKKYSEREFKLGQLAAFIDGEGCITITRDGRGDHFGLQMHITNTNRKLMEWLEENFGGLMQWDVKDKRPNRKPKHRWRLNGRYTQKLLEEMQEFLIIKKEQSEVALKFLYETQQRNYNHGRPEWVIKRQIQYYEQMKLLNKKGDQAED